MDEEVKKEEKETEIFDLLKRLNVKESFSEFSVEELKDFSKRCCEKATTMAEELGVDERYFMCLLFYLMLGSEKTIENKDE